MSLLPIEGSLCSTHLLNATPYRHLFFQSVGREGLDACICKQLGKSRVQAAPYALKGSQSHVPPPTLQCGVVGPMHTNVIRKRILAIAQGNAPRPNDVSQGCDDGVFFHPEKTRRQTLLTLRPYM